MSSLSFSTEKRVAISAVLKASLLAQKVQQELIIAGGVTKKDKSPVTGKFLLSFLPQPRPRPRLRFCSAPMLAPTPARLLQRRNENENEY